MYTWRGKRLTLKQYNARLIRQNNGLKRRKHLSSHEESNENPPGGGKGKTSDTDELQESGKIVSTSDLPRTNEKIATNDTTQTESLAATLKLRPGEGRRIVELEFLGQQMWCTYCKEALSFQFIEAETRRGLCSVLTIRCHKCLLQNQISTSKSHSGSDKRTTRHDVNTKSALGALHAGLGWTHVDKFLSCMNIPCYDYKTFKRYETEVGVAGEAVAKESCEHATELERQMTVEQLDILQKSLPEDYRQDFIIKKRSVDSTNDLDEEESNSSRRPVNFDDVVRLMVSYDMGWSTRGSGRSYDSLNGFGAIIGHFSGMVLDYSTCNRKCSKCERTDYCSKHDCRLNFFGSAKAMEPHVGRKLVVESEILKSKNTEVGVLVGDDDSSTVLACRNASDHPIIKQSDKNHASGGVKKQLYTLEKSSKELTKDRITYLHRCFTFAVAQNIGNSPAMAAAIRSIPHHAFNDHSICGSWCGYHEDQENYDHSSVPGGFSDKKLYEALKKIFDKLAANAEKFSMGASSNRNESLNATVASKAPKQRCYSQTASADFRVGFSVGQKNLGVTYTQEINEKIELSPGRHLSRHIARTDRALLRTRATINTHAFKKRRAQNKKIRGAIRHRRENTEGLTYKSNCGLLTQSAVPEPIEEEPEDNIDDDDHPIILFDLETSGFQRDCDILQIAAKCGRHEFSIYIKPKQQIAPSATAVHGLINCNGSLMLHGKAVPSSPMQDALRDFLNWIENFGKKCYLAAHNLRFDGPRLYSVITKYNLGEKFSTLIQGFIDTLPMLKKTSGRTGKGQCSLGTLAESLHIVVVGAHNAIYDCKILAKVLRGFNITNNDLINCATLYEEQVMHWSNQDKNKENLTTLKPLEKFISPAIRKKLASAGITIEDLKRIYCDNGVEGIKRFFEEKTQRKEVKFQVKTVDKILDFLGKEKTSQKI